LAFDDSPAGERLRRCEQASASGMARSLETLLKIHRATKPVGDPFSVVTGPFFVVSSPLPVANLQVEASEQQTPS
jgi:hypothetical protein